VLLLILFNYSNLIYGAKGKRRENVPKFWASDKIKPNERVSYNFPNNLSFDISTDSLIELYIEYENNIRNRQTSFFINNSYSINLNISLKSRLENFNSTNAPKNLDVARKNTRYNYDCIMRIRTNETIENLTIQYEKNLEYGLNPNKSYSLAMYKQGEVSWEMLDTTEKVNETSLETFIMGSLYGIEEDTDYYITVFEIKSKKEDLTWLYLTIIIVAIGIISIAFLISKKDYFLYLKTRTVSIDKGAHRLSLTDVLENENRNMIIELILKEPGIHFNELLRKTGLAAGNLVWHLDILQTYKVIGKKRIGNFISYFPYYQKNPISNVDLKLQKSKLTLEILELIEEDPGIWNNLITKKFKVDHKTIQYHLKKLLELNLVSIKKEGRKNKLYPNFDAEYFRYKDNNLNK